jgi:hypothetical protein
MQNSDWASFLAYSNLFGIKGFVVVVVITFQTSNKQLRTYYFKKKQLRTCKEDNTCANPENTSQADNTCIAPAPRTS